MGRGSLSTPKATENDDNDVDRRGRRGRGERSSAATPCIAHEKDSLRNSTPRPCLDRLPPTDATRDTLLPPPPLPPFPPLPSLPPPPTPSILASKICDGHRGGTSFMKSSYEIRGASQSPGCPVDACIICKISSSLRSSPRSFSALFKSSAEM